MVNSFEKILYMIKINNHIYWIQLLLLIMRIFIIKERYNKKIRKYYSVKIINVNFLLK